MPDEYTFAIAKAVLVVASTVGLVLFLAWVAARKCFPEASDVAVRKAVSRAVNQGVEQPEMSLAVAPFESVRKVRRRFLLPRLSWVKILSAGHELFNESRFLLRLFKSHRWATEFSDGTTSKMTLPPS